MLKVKHKKVKHYITINKKYHNESTALEQFVLNYCGLKLALHDLNPHPASIVVKTYICSVRVRLCKIQLCNKQHFV